MIVEGRDFDPTPARNRRGDNRLSGDQKAGLGYFIYGKKQQSVSPIVGGILMMTVSYFIASALLMSLLSLGIAGGVYILVKRGY